MTCQKVTVCQAYSRPGAGAHSPAGIHFKGCPGLCALTGPGARAHSAREKRAPGSKPEGWVRLKAGPGQAGGAHASAHGMLRMLGGRQS